MRKGILTITILAALFGISCDSDKSNTPKDIQPPAGLHQTMQEQEKIKPEHLPLGEIVDELKNLNDGKKYSLKMNKRDDRHPPYDNLYLLYSPKEGFQLIDSSSATLWSNGNIYSDRDANGWVDMFKREERHFIADPVNDITDFDKNPCKTQECRDKYQKTQFKFRAGVRTILAKYNAGEIKFSHDRSVE